MQTEKKENLLAPEMHRMRITNAILLLRDNLKEMDLILSPAREIHQNIAW